MASCRLRETGGAQRRTVSGGRRARRIGAGGSWRGYGGALCGCAEATHQVPRGCPLTRPTSCDRRRDSPLSSRASGAPLASSETTPAMRTNDWVELRRCGRGGSADGDGIRRMRVRSFFSGAFVGGAEARELFFGAMGPNAA